MSYPYDTNPWDDNYTPASNFGQQQDYSGTSYTGYSNPMSTQYEYDTTLPRGEIQQLYENPGAELPVDSGAGTGQQNESYKTSDYSNANKQESPINRFLRQRLPFYGAFMDFVDPIATSCSNLLFKYVNRQLLVSKIFYFFFYSAFGSLFPLMGVYFKQLGMNPAQVGILTGVRPFIEIFSAPFWHSLAGRFHKSKSLLLFSLFSWIVFTYSLAHIRPPASACIAFNNSDFVLYTPYGNDDLSNFEINQLDESQVQDSAESTRDSGGSETGSPLSKVSAREGKDAILVKEESQNEQRRRRRRDLSGDQDQTKTNLYANDKRFSYAFEGDHGGFHSEPVELELDLESDFDDRPLGQVQGRAHLSEDASFFGFESEPGDDVEPYELEQSQSGRSLRYKRSKKSSRKDDSEEEEAEEEEETSKLHSKGNQEKARKSNSANSAAVSGEDYEAIDETNEDEQQRASASNNESPGQRSAQVQAQSSEQSQHLAAISSGGQGKSEQSKVTATEMLEGTQRSTTADGVGGQPETVKSAMNDNSQAKSKRVFKQRHKTPPTHVVGMSPITVEYAVNYNKEKHEKFVTPMFSTIVYKLDDIKEVFFLLLLLISLGEFFSAPALTLADSATLSYLGEDTDQYGRQRMFGSLSWAITLLLVGMALDNSTSIAGHPCGPHVRERSYTVCYVIFSLLMACAFLTATQFKFSYPKSATPEPGPALTVKADDNNNTFVTTNPDGTYGAPSNIDDLYATTQPRSIFNTAPPINAPQSDSNRQGVKEKFEFLDKWKSAVFAQNTWEPPEWVNVFRQFKNSLHLMYLFITWFLGCGVGLVFTFLFWHLQDVGGTPTLFGICSVINHISEILAYFFSFNFIKRFGHTKVLSVGLGCNVIRFLYVAILTDPYYALPFELVQGITHAACFAACCSYISHVSKPELRTSTQGVMQGLHHGIGRACGALLGGYMINAIGSRASFCIYGILSGCVLGGFLYIRRKATLAGIAVEEEVKVEGSEEAAALGGYGAPQGVPSC